MTPETQRYWERMLIKLQRHVDDDEARAIFTEVMRRVGPVGTTRAYTVALLKVASERGLPAQAWLGK